MSFEGHIENGVVVLNQPVSLPNGTPVRIEVIAPAKTPAERFKNVIGAAVDLPDDMAKNHDAPSNAKHADDPGCFSELSAPKPLSEKETEALGQLLTPDQLEALSDLASRGGPDVEAIARLRSKSMT